MDGNMGFTGIMVAWRGKFNPLIMAGISFFINFLSRGMAQVCTDFGFTSQALSDIVVGLIYFFFIGCEFFIVYKVHFNFVRRGGREAPDFRMEQDALQENASSAERHDAAEKRFEAPSEAPCPNEMPCGTDTATPETACLSAANGSADAAIPETACPGGTNGKEGGNSDG